MKHYVKLFLVSVSIITVLIFFYLLSSAKRSPLFLKSFELLKKDERVLKKVGNIRSTGFWKNYSYKKVGGTENSEFAYYIFGDKGEALVVFETEKSDTSSLRIIRLELK